MKDILKAAFGHVLGLRFYAYVAMVAVILGFGLGWHLESVRFAEHRGAVEALGEAALKGRVQQIKNDNNLKEKTDADHRRRMASLAAQLERLRHPSGSLMPAASEPAGGGGELQGSPVRLCFNGGELRDRLVDVAGSLRARIAQGAERYAPAVAGFETCAAWAIEQHDRRAK